MRRFFKLPKRLLYKKYAFLNLNLIKEVKLEKPLKTIFVNMFMKLRVKYKLNFKALKLNKSNKLRYFNKKNNTSSFVNNLKKLYKNKKLNIHFIKRKMYKKWMQVITVSKNVDIYVNHKRLYMKSYFFRGANTRSLLKRTMITTQATKYSNISWIKVNSALKKPESWWVIRELKRKVAFYYGFINIKKFRYISNFNKNMSVNSNYGIKLECMLNIFFLRLNLFDNIFQINNLIRKTRFININNKLCTYPYRVINVFDTVSINKYYFKRMLNIFIKRCRFNKSYVIKSFIKKGYKRKKIIKNVVNVPNFIEYNYKIMHFTMIDRPKLNQIKSQGFGLDNESLFTWSVNTKLKYHYK